MSLLLDARTKTQATHTPQSGRAVLESGQHDHAQQQTDAAKAEVARSTGKKLFSAKAPSQSLGHTGINQNLLILLGGAAILFSAAGGYLWHINSTSDTQSLRPSHSTAPTPRIAPVTTATVQTPAANQSVDTPPDSPAPVTSGKVADRIEQSARTPQQPAAKLAPRAVHAKPIAVRQQQAAGIDALLNEAYRDYRNAEFTRAQQLYRAALAQDEHNIDALLGLAVIAQHQEADDEAAHFYQRVLTLDPRNAVANAGMSELGNDENRESRLKTLLYEQPDSPSLYLALGNHYAAQSRWSDAQQAYFNAYKYDTDNAGLAFNLAISLDRLGQNKLAAQHYRRALQLDTNNSAGFDHSAISRRVQELSR